jgi:hypothetical protein
MEPNPTKQRQHFYRDYATTRLRDYATTRLRDYTSGQWSMSELCARYQISVDRIEAEGLKAVEDRSRAPNRHPNRAPEHVEQEILVLREKYGWGATRLCQS